jgi:peptidoglycan/LPS O-acetylase OafA/YrhL
MPHLDGLRGVAIALVLFYHFGHGLPGFTRGTAGAYLMTPLLRLSWCGVDLFFVLSGYLITGILAGLTPGYGSAARFLARRAARILPLYAVVLGLALAGRAAYRADPSFFPQLFGAFSGAWSYLTFLQNDWFALGHAQINAVSVTWSVAIEEKFYLLFPLLVFGLRLGSDGRFMRTLAMALAGLAALSLVVRCVPVGETQEAWMYFATICRLDGLAIGGLVWLMRHAGVRIPAWALWATLAATGAALLAEANAKGALGPLTYSVTSLFFGAILCAALQWKALAGPLSFAPLGYIGRISYGLYLLHIPVLGVVTGLMAGMDTDLLGPRPVAASALAFALAVGLASLSWFALERPILAWTRPWTRNG